MTIFHALFSVAENVQLQAGQEIAVEMPDNGRTMKVYLPSNYSPDNKWPVIFFYHGAHGKPTTSPIKEYTDGKDFVIIGMPYAAENEVPTTQQEAEAILQKELDNFRSARRCVGQRIGIDEKRVFMGGISLGGWQVSTLSECEMPRLAGVIILLAGRQRSKTEPKEAAALKMKPFYIGAGETDPNLVPALKAADFYRRRGAVVTHEVFRDTGHAAPLAVPPKFKVWLEAQGGETNEAKRKELEEKLRAQSPDKEESLAEKSFFDLLPQDSNMKTLHDLKMVRSAFAKLGKTYPGTFYGKLALQYSECLALMYQKALESVPGNQPGIKYRKP